MNVLHRIYNTLNDLVVANNMQARITCFADFGNRLLDTDLKCFIKMNNDLLRHLNDPFFPQRANILCHDQEPILYTSQHAKWKRWRFETSSFDDRMIIVTSERNSPELTKFCQDFDAIPCHYFSNGALAHGWYSEHRWNLPNYIHATRPRLHYKFSCLNRLISEQRCYRPVISRFLQDTVNAKELRLSCMLVDPITGDTPNTLALPSKYKYMFKGIDYDKPILVNTLRKDLDDQNNIQNKSFNPARDYFSKVFCHIVTETLFTDSTLHLTEKSMRAFVNKRPMIMLGPPHSLSYLQSYGFKTFNDFWDESYDQIDDPWSRLDAVMNLISNLNKLSLDDMEDMLDAMTGICEHNFRHFYENFPNIIMQELVDNMKSSIIGVKAKPINGWMYNRINDMSEARINGLLNGPLNDFDYDNNVLYDDWLKGDNTKIDKNLARLLILEHGVDKKSSKEDILARFRTALC